MKAWPRQNLLQNDPPQQPITQVPKTPAICYVDVATLDTKQDFANLLTDIKLLAADVDLVRAEVQMDTDRIRASEEDILDIRQDVYVTKDTV
ncbi:Hypothetical predicted protein [Pelobates cultripes]|uniref:Uncharacterized protein n=1 Tax=Pelobates cultripes TaxID=61616 RepID=A0AAD1RWN1_PELCU|nr:Hypothetical predicted protein [Pelobates cultripes]